MISLNEPLQYVQIICTDNSGSSFIRLRWNALYLQSFQNTNIIPIVSNVPIMQPDILLRTKAVIWQRPTAVAMVKNLKCLQPKFGYKMIAEFDDIIWDFFPEYNTLPVKTENNKKCLTETLPFFDTVIVSTDYLKHNMEKTFSIFNVIAVENVVPKFLYSIHRSKLTADLTKPRILWAGANQHFRNPIPYTVNNPGMCGLKGDWSDEWIDFILKNVKENKIEFIMMGGAIPYFFEEIKEKITIIPWVDSNTFPRTYMSTNPDFVIAPLAENEFNKCKSNLAYIQACAIGAAFIGSKFKDSPYENTITDLNDFWKYTNKEKYNSIIDYQDKFMIQSGSYLESSKHLNKFLSVMDNSDIERR